MAPVSSDRGLQVLPTCTFETCPSLDLICVPGGGGVADAIADDETVDFVRRQADGATYVTSVCTGAFVLGAAASLGYLLPGVGLSVATAGNLSWALAAAGLGLGSVLFPDEPGTARTAA